MSDAKDSRAGVPGSERTMPSGATIHAPASAGSLVRVTVVVRRRAHVEHAHHRLERATFAATHGADPADVVAVEAFALRHGIVVLEANLAKRTIELEGTVAAMSAAFGVTLHDVEWNGSRFRGRTGPVTVPSELADAIVGVFGLDSRPAAKPHFRIHGAFRPRVSGDVSYTPPQLAQIYGFPQGVDGTGQTIALVELGGGYTESDLATYFAGLGIAEPTVIAVPVGDGSNSPTGDPNGPDTEVMLDIEVAGAIAPGATIVVYFADNTDAGFLSAITSAIHDTTHTPQIVSISWGGPESTWTTQAFTNFDAAFQDAATLGISVFVAAGDNGSTDGVSDGAQHVDFPASSPNVVACGGTKLIASGATATSETVWNDGSGGGATGGGVSDTFPLPAYQASAGVPVSVNPGNFAGRGVPDVAADADPATGYTVRSDGSDTVVGGTSAVAPLYAGLTALINQARGVSLGSPNAFLYANPGAFKDVTSGSNGAFDAGAGWDACTGLGAPRGAALLAALGAAPAPVTPLPPVPSAPPASAPPASS